MRDSPPFRSDSVDSLWPASTRTEYIPLIMPFPPSFGSRKKGLTHFNDTELGLRDEERTLRFFPVFFCGVRPEQRRKIQNKQRCPQTEIHTSRVRLLPEMSVNCFSKKIKDKKVNKQVNIYSFVCVCVCV